MARKTTRIDDTERYRFALVAERTRLTRGDGSDLEVLAVPAGVAAEDQGPLMHDQFVALRQRRMVHTKLKLIDAALKRLDRGTFGICGECEEPIPPKRLNAVPWAAYCVHCQDAFDAQAEADQTLQLIA